MTQFRFLRNPAAAGLALLAPLAPACPQGTAPVVALRAGMVITHSVRVAKRTWNLPATASHDSGVIVIRGNDLTVDFGGATLEGMSPQDDPDLARGIAIRVEEGRNVRIVNARLRGYKVAILARGTTNLSIEQVDASNNWKPRLFSVVEHESLVDWLSFHHNEKGEWMRFGAAFYLDGVRGGSIHWNRAEQGMNALLMVRTTGVSITENDFSYNSGLGIGLYRSSGNTIVGNRLDFDVRGYSHGFYRRGQDSAGILLYEQSSDNVIAFNSATHGGDGFFLWAGQSTMDTGEGGANDNWLVGNDFSWAPANGIEATFSRNFMVGNRLEGNDYGIWGGYSYSSRMTGNCFIRNRIGVAIEHGQDNRIDGNAFFGDTTAISLWANPIEPSDWGYPGKHDTRSRDYSIAGNDLAGHRVGVRAVNTDGITFSGNRVRDVDSLTVLRDTSRYVARNNVMSFGSRAPSGASVTPGSAALEANAPSGPAAPRGCAPTSTLDSVPAAIRARIGAHIGTRIGPAQLPPQPLARLDRSAMIVDEWGPYDWKSPKLWPVDSTRAPPLRLRVLGPTGRWRLVARRGVAAISRDSGAVGDTIMVTPAGESAGDWSLQLQFVGGPTRTPRGEAIAAGTAYRFGYERFEPSQHWAVLFFTWSDTTGGAPVAATRAIAGMPIMERDDSRLDYFWYRPALHELPQAHWALSATSHVDLAPGHYTLRTISDDGVRVWVDGKLAIDRWTHHESQVDHAALAGGPHDLRVEYFQDDGWAELRLDIVHGTERSEGSPGPH